LTFFGAEKYNDLGLFAEKLTPKKVTATKMHHIH
jgi:hypothetical protein